MVVGLQGVRVGATGWAWAARAGAAKAPGCPKEGFKSGAHLGTGPQRPSPAPRRPPSCPRPGGGSREPGRSAQTAPAASAAQASTHFAGAGDRRAVDAQAAHAAGGRASRQADGRL